MRRTVVKKSTAVKAAIVFLSVLILLSIYPFRLWNRTITEHGDAEIVSVSDRVNDYHDVVQKFIAQYDRIGSLDVYVNGLEKGQYMTLIIYNPDMSVLYKRFYYLGDKELPGYVTIPTELDVKVGEIYTVRICGCFSTFYLGYSGVDKARYPYLLQGSYFGNELTMENPAIRFNYEQPIAKSRSLLLMLGVVAICALLCLIVRFIFGNKRDSLVTVHSAIKWVANPIAVIIIAALMVAVFPLRIFDKRVIDIVFYEVGILIAGFFMLYAINHENDATLDIKLWHNLHNFLKMSMIAAALWFCCEYMNAFYTIYQTLAERKEMICLLILLCLMIPKEKVLQFHNLVYVLSASVVGIIYRNMHLMAATEKEYDLNNAALTYGVIIVILTGFIVISILIEVYGMIKNKAAKLNGAVLSVSGIFFALLCVSLIIFRNTRWWGVVMALFAMTLLFFYGRFESAEDGIRKGYLELVVGGLLMNFVVSMIYCWLHRCFTAFNTGRYPFLFHTVTVTAEYMTVMVCASMVLLLYKIYDTRDKKSFKEKFRYLWKEFMLFGFVTAYMIFTMSRTAYLSCVVMFLLTSILTVSDIKEKRLKYWGSQILILAFSIIVCFPAAFTLQRVLPAIYKHPKTYMIEVGNEGLNGGGDPASMLYMSVERFVDLFSEKILGSNLIDYNYPEDALNYDENGNPIYGDNGVTLTQRQSEHRKTSLRDIVFSADTDEETRIYLMESAGLDLNISYDELVFENRVLDDDEPEETREEEEKADLLSEEGMESVSNGRLSIFKSYIQQMNLWGHDEMGAVLENGEVAVHAHNTYIQVMYDNGILTGIFFLLFVFISIVLGGVFYKKNRDVIPGALLPYAMTICFAVAALSEWVFQFSNPMTIALILAITPVAVRKK